MLSTGSNREEGQASVQQQGDGGDPCPVSSPSPSSPGARGCPWTPKGRWAGRPPAPPAWRRRQPPSCWLSSPGWCHPRGTKVSAGVYGHSGAPGERQPTGSRSLRGLAVGKEGWREGCPGTAMPAKASVPAGYGEPAGVRRGVRGGAEGVLGGIQRGAENQPLHHALACGRAAFPLTPCSRGGHRPADVCWMERLDPPPSPAARQLGQRSKALALFGGVSPFPAPRPHPLAMLPALLAGDAPASWPQVRNKSQRLHEKGTSQLNGTSACGLWQGGSAASPPGETALLPGSPTHPHHQPCARPGPLCSPREPWQRGKRVGIKGLWKRVGDLKKLVGSGGE